LSENIQACKTSLWWYFWKCFATNWKKERKK